MINFGSARTGPLPEPLWYEFALWYWFGISFLIFVPYLRFFQIKIRILDLLLVPLLFIVLIRVIAYAAKTDDYTITVSKSLIIVLLFLFLTQLWPLFGNMTLLRHNYAVSFLNFIVPIRRVFLLLLLVAQYLLLSIGDWRKVQGAILNGAIHGGLISVTWMIFEHLSWILFKVPVNKMIFAEVLGLDPGHTFLNLVSLNTGSVLRATGFSWSPGLVGPPLLMIAILYLLLPADLTGQKSNIQGALLLSGPILSLSRTGIFGLGIFLVFTIALVLMTEQVQRSEDIIGGVYSNATIHQGATVALIVGIGAVIGFFYLIGVNTNLLGGVVGFVLNTIYDPAPGVIRHVGYIVYLPSMLTYDMYGALFGYGVYTTGAGVELAASSLPGIDRAAKIHHGHWRVEPQFVSILLAGGLPGAISFLYAYFGTLLHNLRTQLASRSSNRELRVAIFCSTFLSTTFVLGLGYGVGGTFFLVILVLIIFWTWNEESEPNR